MVEKHEGDPTNGESHNELSKYRQLAEAISKAAEEARVRRLSFDAFYADEIEVTTDAETEAMRGKERIRALLFKFLVPLHVMAEIGGLSVQIRESRIHGDTADETHSAWSVDLTGVSGRTCKLAWCTLRRWADSRVVYERHYDHQQTGGPLTGDDLRLSPSRASLGDQWPS